MSEELEMQVGLLSMHRVANYGSFWQAYCLKDIIRSLDKCEVEFIDIIPGEVESRTNYKKSFSFSKISRIPYYVFQNNKKKIFQEYQSSALKCPREPNYRNNYDAIIIGSDEVFNFAQKSPWGFSTQLYGDIENDNVSSYAACFGYTTLEDIKSTHRAGEISKALSNLNNISVRDQNSANIIEELIGKKPETHLDPVLVGDLPGLLPEISNSRYILVYSYDFRLSDPDVIRQVRELAKEKYLKIYSVGFYQSWVDKNILPNPIELLSYFNNAEYVVTDTFHGTIFSARMHKKFVTVIRETNRQKLGDLLLRIGMDQRRYSKGDSLISILNNEIDYEGFEAIRIEERNRTELYLRKCLGK